MSYQGHTYLSRENIISHIFALQSAINESLDLFVEKTSGFFENRELLNVVSIYYSLDIDKAFPPYVYECVRSGPFLKRSPFCSSHIDAV